MPPDHPAKGNPMSSSTSTERAVSDVRQAAFEISATDQRQACRLLLEALKLQPGHADLLGDLAVLHLQGGRHAQCIQAAQEALHADPTHDESAYAIALALEASGQPGEARRWYEELAVGARAERFRAAQPGLAEQCHAKLAQLAALPAAAPLPQPAAAVQPPAEPDTALPASGRTEAPMVVLPADLGHLLDETRGIRALTLDCFDTILWRQTERPTDVFHELQNRPAFRAAGIDAALRERAERLARQLQWVRTGRTEVNLAQIYRAARPDLRPELLNWLAEDELAAEMQACHAHPGAVRLLRDARRRGLPVTIVSDTYLDAAQLRRLLAHALPADAYAAIGEVVCSSEHGLCKSQGLFKLARLNLEANADEVLHVGDNRDADVRAPRALGMSATHLMHGGERVAQRRRMGAAIVSMMDPNVRAARPLYMPYRALLAGSGSDTITPAAAIGHAAMGPLMHAFVRWLEEEGSALAATRQRVKLVFLMRDAHLPLASYCEMGGSLPACAAQISRFTAFAASFRRPEHVDHYIAHFGNNLTPEMLARQLLLSPERTESLLNRPDGTVLTQQGFLQAVRQPEVLAEIFEASARYREQLHRYLQRSVQLTRGDTLVLVDLGYAGTIQRVLGPVISEEWGAEVEGRYLLSVGAADPRQKGLMDQRWLDGRTLATLQPYVGVIETLCASEGASVLHYDDEGQPVYESEQIAGTQNGDVFEIQAECLRFVREAEAYFQAARWQPSTDALRDEALASFGRLMFMPTEQELEHLGRFELEINLGSGVARRLFDVEAGLDALRRQGLFYVGETQNGKRMTVPAELRAAGLELSLSLLAQNRFGLELTRNDWSTRTAAVNLIVSREGRSANVGIDAQPTHDGYFATFIPLPQSHADIGLVFGQHHAWLQLHSAELVPLGAARVKDEDRVDARPLFALSGVVDHGHGLLQFEGPDSLLMLPAGSWPGEGRAGLRLVFRPLAPREAGTA